jgi:hypothetical protein
MPVFGADLLPDTTGRNLGNPSQRWNASLQSLNVLGATSLQPVSGQTITPGGAIFVLTSPVTANANTTGVQSLATCVIPAGLLNAAGKVLRAIMTGVYTTQAGQTPALQISVGMPAGVFVLSVATPALSAAQAHNTWRCELTVVVTTPGSAAVLETGGTLFYQPAAAQNSYPIINTQYTSLGPVDLTAQSNLTAYCLFTTNSAPANVCILRQFIVEVLN